MSRAVSRAVSRTRSAGPASAIYAGDIRHRRFEPTEHAFTYPLFLVYLEGRKVEDVSRILDLPEGTIKTRLMRGREKLRRILVRTNPDYFGDSHALP